MDLLVIGGSGFIGAKLTQAAVKAGYIVAYTYSRHIADSPATPFQVRIEEEGALEECVTETQPRNIIYCALPQGDNSLHYAVSIKGVSRAIATLAQSSHCKFIYISTNAVFSGKHGPYYENDKPDPEERFDQYRLYAQTRAAGEQVALSNWPNTIVVRTADVNGRDLEGNLNPRLAAIVEQLQAGQEIQRLVNCYISPSLVDNVIEGILEITNYNFNYRGILHLAGSQPISYYEYARLVAHHIHADKNLVKADMTKTWNISLDVAFTQRLLKTQLLNVECQLATIFAGQ